MAATISRRLVSIADAADALAVSTRMVRRYIADGQLDAVRLGRKTLGICCRNRKEALESASDLQVLCERYWFEPTRATIASVSLCRLTRRKIPGQRAHWRPRSGR